MGDAAEPGEPPFGQAPEALDAVDAVKLAGELVLPVLDTEVLVVAEVHQTLIAHPAVGMEHGAEACPAANHRLQCGFGGIGHDGRVDLVAALEQAEDDGLPTCSAAVLAAHALWAEVGFVGLQHSLQRRLPLALGDDLSAHA